jgi:hypothetical protein
MLLKRSQIPILIFTLIYLIIFSILFFKRKNYEFIMYVGVILFFFFVILLTNKKINYPNIVLGGLSFWGLLHMSGGGILINGNVLYKFILIPLSSTYEILKYDQFVHIVGFGIATLVMYVLLEPKIKKPIKKWTSISIIVIMAGLGVGAINEIIEFIAVVIMPETNVGGFMNMSLDLVSDLIGACLAMIYIRIKKGKI